MNVNYNPVLGKIHKSLEQIAGTLEKVAQEPEPIVTDKPDPMLETLQAVRVLLEKMAHPVMVADPVISDDKCVDDLRSVVEDRNACHDAYKKTKAASDKLAAAVVPLVGEYGRKASMGGLEDTYVLQLPVSKWDNFQKAIQEYREACDD
jgi:hypothetical protein